MEETDRCLNIGSGRKPHKGWINADINLNPDIDVIADWTALPFTDESFDVINAGQVIEHLHVFQRGQALKEAWRVLRYGGELHIDVPDLRRCCAKYLEGKKSMAMSGLYGRGWLRGGGHQWGYDEITLNQLIWDAGFAVIGMRVDEAMCPPYIFLRARKVLAIYKYDDVGGDWNGPD